MNSITRLLIKTIFATGLLGISLPVAIAQNSQSIEFVGVDGLLLENVRKHVRLVDRLNNPKPLRPSEQRRLQRSVAIEVQQALEPLGYYKAVVRRDLSAREQVLRYQVELNEPVRIESLNITIEEHGEARGDFNEWRSSVELKVGDILDQALYERHKKALLSRALKLGYFDANFAQSEILINRARTRAAITLHFVPGQRYAVGEIKFDWQFEEADEKTKRGLKDSVLLPLVTLKTGQLYDAEQVNQTQQNLAAAPFFARVEVNPGEPNAETLQVPITLKVTPRKRKAFNFEVGAGTDTGIRGGIGFENRRINTSGHTVNARIGASEIARSALFNYRIPQPTEWIESTNLFASSSQRLGGNRQFEADKIGADLRWHWQDADVTLGIEASREQSSRIDETRVEANRTIDLLVPRIGIERTKVDDLYFPSKGWSASLKIRGANEAVVSDINLLQGELDLKRLFPLGQGRVKLRLRLAGSLISDATELPESLGFLAGGDDSVRGYRFESIGVERNGEVTVGKNLIVMSAEYQHPIKNNFSLATFIDAGDAFDGHADYKKGVGAGIRWRLPFGALRLDLASALDREGDPLRLHFSFGTDL